MNKEDFKYLATVIGLKSLIVIVIYVVLYITLYTLGVFEAFSIS